MLGHIILAATFFAAMMKLDWYTWGNEAPGKDIPSPEIERRLYLIREEDKKKATPVPWDFV